MKKLLLLLVLLFMELTSYGSVYFNHFRMGWKYVDAQGVDIPNQDMEICGGTTIYIVNTSTGIPQGTSTNSTPVSVGSSMDPSGYYAVYAWPGSASAQIVDIPVTSWHATNVAFAIYIPVGATYTNLRIKHFGYGSSPVPNETPSSEHATRSITIHNETADAGADIITCHNAGTLISGTGSGSPSGLIWSYNGNTYNNPSQQWIMNTSGLPIIQTHTLTNSQTYQTVSGPITCTASDDMTITINVGPQIIPQNYSLCDGDPFPTLYGAAALDYEWRYTPVGATNYTIVGTGQNFTTMQGAFGEYTLITTAANGCVSSGSHFIELSPSAGSNMDATFNSSSTNTSTMTTYNVSSAVAGQHLWELYQSDASGAQIALLQTSSNSTAQTHTFSQVPKNGDYKIVHKVGKAPCNQWAEDYALYFFSGFIVYPNPVSSDEEFNISVTNQNSEGDIYISDVNSGKVVFQDEVSVEESISLTLPSSVYSIKLVVENEIVMSKTIVVN